MTNIPMEDQDTTLKVH